jgi:hypothetical protein
MGMGVDIGSLTGNYGTKKDVSFLLNSLPSRSGSATSLNFLSDYASIKNGSYGKLMNAYYGTGKERVSNAVNSSSTSTSKDSKEKLQNVKNAADSLKVSADKLLVTGAKSLFNTKEVTSTDDKGVTTTTTTYDVNAIYKAVSSFVSEYNNTIEKGSGANSNSISTRVNSLNNMTKANQNLLGKVGITVGSDGKLALDEAAFKKADMASVKSIFNGTGSYGYQVSSQASWLSFGANNELSKANTYNASGNYSNNNSNGDIFSSYF